MRALLPIGAVALLLLAGCSAAPPRDDIVERLTIEYESATGWTERDDSEMVEILTTVADSMLEGACGAPSAWTVYSDSPDLFYAWATTCDMYFSADMSEYQRGLARDLLLERITEDRS